MSLLMASCTPKTPRRAERAWAHAEETASSGHPVRACVRACVDVCARARVCVRACTVVVVVVVSGTSMRTRVCVRACAWPSCGSASSGDHWRTGAQQDCHVSHRGHAAGVALDRYACTRTAARIAVGAPSPVARTGRHEALDVAFSFHADQSTWEKSNSGGEGGRKSAGHVMSKHQRCLCACAPPFCMTSVYVLTPKSTFPNRLLSCNLLALGLAHRRARPALSQSSSRLGPAVCATVAAKAARAQAHPAGVGYPYGFQTRAGAPPACALARGDNPAETRHWERLILETCSFSRK